MPTGSIGSLGWRSCGRRPRDCRWPSRSGSPSRRWSNSWRRICIRRRSGAGSPSRSGWPATSPRWSAARRLGVARALVLRPAGDVCGRCWPGSCGSRSPRRWWRRRGISMPRTRRQVDAELAAAGITGMGYRQAVACARRHAYEADRAGYVARGRTERKHRRVGIRAAPDTMAILSGYLPVEQAAACYAGLRRHAARLRATVMSGARIRSWPTPWSSCSPDRPGPRTSTSRSRSPCRSTASSTPTAPTVPDGPDPDIRRPDRAGRPGENGASGRPRAAAAGSGPGDHRHQPGPQMVAAPVHRPERAADRRRPDPAPVRRLAGPADLTAGSDLPRPVLRRPDPPLRPHPPLLRRRPHHLQQRPRHLRPRQPSPRDARLAGDVDPLRATHRTPHRSSDHSHRTQPTSVVPRTHLDPLGAPTPGSGPDGGGPGSRPRGPARRPPVAPPSAIRTR